MLKILKKLNKEALVQCSCGKVFITSHYNAKTGRVKSCGCASAQKTPKKRTKPPVETGLKVGELQVLGPHPIEPNTFNCVCSCGNRLPVSRYRLEKRKIKSCGCLALKNYMYQTVRTRFTQIHNTWFDLVVKLPRHPKTPISDTKAVFSLKLKRSLEQ